MPAFWGVLLLVLGVVLSPSSSSPPLARTAGPRWGIPLSEWLKEVGGVVLKGRFQVTSEGRVKLDLAAFFLDDGSDCVASPHNANLINNTLLVFCQEYMHCVGLPLSSQPRFRLNTGRGGGDGVGHLFSFPHRIFLYMIPLSDTRDQFGLELIWSLVASSSFSRNPYEPYEPLSDQTP